MMLYLILVILFGLAIVVCGGYCVYAIIVKNKKGIKFSLLGILIAIIGTIFCGGMYAKKTVDYVKSDEFQKDTKILSSKMGETTGNAVSGASDGFAKGLDEEAITKLASKSGSILAKSIKTIAGAMDSTLESKHIFIDKSLEDAGFDIGRAETNYNNTLKIYFNYTKDFKGKLKLIAYDIEGKKMDVTVISVDVKAKEEKVEKFEFKNTELGVTTYFILYKI